MRLLSLSLAVLCAAVLSGCATAPPESYYTLSAAGRSAGAPVAKLPSLGLAVSAASVNEAVDRPQLVMQLSPTRVQILEQQRWAEPLRTAIPRVVGADLARLLGTSNVWAHPQVPAGDVAYRVTLDVVRFESRSEGATVEVAWMVRRLPAGEAKTGRSVATERAAGGYDGLVEAHSRALDTVSREIAQAVADLAR